MTVPTDTDALREHVRERYAAAATSECRRTDANTCCGSEVITDEQRAFFGQSQYAVKDRDAVPDRALLASLGCGNPLAIAELHEGEVVLDLGSGGGIDVLLSARRVGRTGLAYGRCVYQGIGEHAVYVEPGTRGRGLGRTLLEHLVVASEAAGLYKLTSRIFSDNAPSRAAHHAAGFSEVDVQRRHGTLDGEWKDCVLVEQLLGEAGQ